MTYAIIDDEEDARFLLRNLVQSLRPDLNLIWEADSIATGHSMLGKLTPQLLFLDIQLKDGTGFQLLDSIGQTPCKLVFVTAYDQFAIKAFQYSAVDYLLKPIDPNLFLQAVSKAIPVVGNDSITHLLSILQTQQFDKIMLASETEIFVTPLEDICRMEGDGSYTKVYLKTNEILLISKNLKEFEDVLPEKLFYRIHNSHIVNIKYIKKISKIDGAFVVLNNGESLEISRRRKQDFLEMLMRSNINLG